MKRVRIKHNNEWSKKIFNILKWRVIKSAIYSTLGYACQKKVALAGFCQDYSFVSLILIKVLETVSRSCEFKNIFQVQQLNMVLSEQSGLRHLLADVWSSSGMCTASIPRTGIGASGATAGFCIDHSCHSLESFRIEAPKAWGPKELCRL